MPTKHQPMICPYCGIPMNHHADKAVYALTGVASSDSAQEVIEEFHTCPRCGRAGEKR